MSAGDRSGMQSRTRIRTSPEFRLPRWRSTPTLFEQALEAARDDPDQDEFVRLLARLPGVEIVTVEDHEDRPWLPPQITVSCSGLPDSRTNDVLTIARRAGWDVADLTWERHLIHLEPAGVDSDWRGGRL